MGFPPAQPAALAVSVAPAHAPLRAGSRGRPRTTADPPPPLPPATPPPLLTSICIHLPLPAGYAPGKRMEAGVPRCAPQMGRLLPFFSCLRAKRGGRRRPFPVRAGGQTMKRQGRGTPRPAGCVCNARPPPPGECRAPWSRCPTGTQTRGAPVDAASPLQTAWPRRAGSPDNRERR